jgi:hypothetical protein
LTGCDTARRREVFGSLIPNIVLGRFRIGPIGCGFDAVPTRLGRCDDWSVGSPKH